MGYFEATWDSANDWTGFVTTNAADITRSRLNTGMLLRSYNGNLADNYDAGTPASYDWWILKNTTAERVMRVSVAIRFADITGFVLDHVGPFSVLPRDDSGSALAADRIALQMVKKTPGPPNDNYWLQPKDDATQRIDLEGKGQRWLGFNFFLRTHGESGGGGYRFEGRVIIHDLTFARPKQIAAWELVDTAGDIFDFAQFRIGLTDIATVPPNGPEGFELRIDEYRQHTHDPASVVEPGLTVQPRNRYGPWLTTVVT